MYLAGMEQGGEEERMGEKSRAEQRNGERKEEKKRKEKSRAEQNNYISTTIAPFPQRGLKMRVQKADMYTREAG